MDIKSNIDDLHKRVEGLEKREQSLISLIWLGVLLLNFIVVCRIVFLYAIQIPKTGKMCVEMLPGEDLPIAVVLCLDYNYVPVWAGLISLLVLFVLGFVLRKKRMIHLIAVGLIIWCTLMALEQLGSHARIFPFVRLMERLG